MFKTSFDYDLGYIVYLYPDSNKNVGFSELYLTGSKNNFLLSTNILSTGNNAQFAQDLYTSIQYNYPKFQDMDVSIQVGLNNGSFNIEKSQTDIKVEFSKNNFAFITTALNSNNFKPKVIISYSITPF